MKNALLVLLATINLFAGDPPKPPTGAVRVPNKTDFDSHHLKASKYTEAWNYSFYLDNGTYAMVTFSQNNLPMKGEVFGGELSITGFKGKNPSVSRQYPVNRWVWNNELEGLELTSGESTRMAVEGLPGKGHRVYYKTDKNKGYLLDLSFTSAVQGKVIGDGVFNFGGVYFGQVIAIPQGRVEGILVVGSDTLKVKGYGVFEKTWQNKLLADLSGHVLQVFKPNSFSGKILLSENEYGEKVFGYSMVNENGTWFPKLYKAFLGDGKEVKADKKLPRAVDLEYDTGKQSFTRVKDKNVYSPLDNVDGWFAKKAIKAAMGEVKVHRGIADGVYYNVMDK